NSTVRIAGIRIPSAFPTSCDPRNADDLAEQQNQSQRDSFRGSGFLWLQVAADCMRAVALAFHRRLRKSGRRDSDQTELIPSALAWRRTRPTSQTLHPTSSWLELEKEPGAGKGGGGPGAHRERPRGDDGDSDVSFGLVRCRFSSKNLSYDARLQKLISLTPVL